MTTTDSAPATTETDESWLQQDAIYIKTALVLGVLTGIEVFTYFESVHKMSDTMLVILLSALMVIKFGVVAAVFMHLKDDHAVFTKLFTAGLCLAWPVFFAFAFSQGILVDWHWAPKVILIAVPPIIVGAWLGYSWKGGSGQH